LQPPTRYSYALVELYTDLPHGEYEDVGDAIQDAIRADPEARSQAVRRVLDELGGVAVERVLFPGWTLVGYTLPSSIINRSAGRTLVVEMLPPQDTGLRKKGSPADNRGWRAFVVRDGQVLVGPVFQLFYSRSQVGEVGAPSQVAQNLAAQLAGRADPDRRWRDPVWPDAGLMMCGEVNVIYSPKPPGRGTPVVQGFPSFDLIMNPAHKPNNLDAMRRKRRHLSRMRPDAVLLMTANTHGRWVKYAGSRGKRRLTAVEAYRDGQKAEPDRVIKIGNHRVLLFE
jgi:hypothetical protein